MIIHSLYRNENFILGYLLSLCFSKLQPSDVKNKYEFILSFPSDIAYVIYIKYFGNKFE